MNGVMSERDEINVRNQLASRRGRRTERRKGMTSSMFMMVNMMSWVLSLSFSLFPFVSSEAIVFALPS